MPPAPATAAKSPPQGKKILGMSRGQLGIVALIAGGGIIYLVWRARKNASAASSSSSTGTASTGTCPDGSTPDSNGNCPQNSQDFSGQLATLQQEIADLQANSGSGGGGGSSGGSAGGIPGGTAAPPPTPAPTPAGGTPGGGTLPSGNTSAPGQVTKYPAPTGLSARADNPTTLAVSWNPTNPPAQSYTLAVYQMNGKEVHSGSVGGVSSGKISTAVSGLHPSWQYQVHVWANGGSQAPPHATTIVTMPKS